MTNIPLFIADGDDAPRPDEKMVERDAITAVVRDPKTGKVIGLRWNTVNWYTLITGGIEDGQTAEEAARAEVTEETGYKNLRLVAELPRYEAKFYHHPKGVNRHAHFQCFLLELVDDERAGLTKDELAKHEPVWLDDAELAAFRLPEGHRWLMDFIQAEGL